jgi:hypothetical protein
VETVEISRWESTVGVGLISFSPCGVWLDFGVSWIEFWLGKFWDSGVVFLPRSRASIGKFVMPFSVSEVIEVRDRESFGELSEFLWDISSLRKE